MSILDLVEAITCSQSRTNPLRDPRRTRNRINIRDQEVRRPLSPPSPPPFSRHQVENQKPRPKPKLTLNPPNRQFYSLSLRHHPDRNRTDPTASSRFARISSAYQVLGNAAKRASYDRDHGIHAHLAASSTHSTATPGQHPMGSYSSYNANVHSRGASYAGSRPASGLSKRRGVFKGPPPSFYAHGGYGVHWRRGATPGGTGGAGGGTTTGEKMDEDPTAFVDRNPINHFNARGHYRTQSAEDARRHQRRSKEMSAALNEQYIGSPGDFAIRFTLVCCMLMGAGALTGFLWPREKSKNTSGRRRDN